MILEKKKSTTFFTKKCPLLHKIILSFVNILDTNILQECQKIAGNRAVNTMSMVFMGPLLKTIAFGAVATGSMKAYEEIIVTGSRKDRGFTWKARAWEKKIIQYVTIKI